jgi:hypothetical protein
MRLRVAGFMVGRAFVPASPAIHSTSCVMRRLLQGPGFDRGVGSSVHGICRQPVQSLLAGFENQQIPPGVAF